MRILGSTGPVQNKAADEGPATAVTLLGGAGAVPGITTLEGADAGPDPLPLVAITLKVYGVGGTLTRVGTVQESGPLDHVQVFVTSPTAVTVYPVMAEPPSLAGTVQETVAEVFPATAVTPSGGPGVVSPRDAVTGVYVESPAAL
jgi:hypothetical protein